MPSRRHAPTGDPALKTAARVKLRARVKAAAMRDGRGCEIPACVLPSRVILWDSRGPASYVLDEIVPRIIGGSPTDPDNVRPAHKRCNAVAGAHITNQIKRAKRARLAAALPALVIDDF